MINDFPKLFEGARNKSFYDYLPSLDVLVTMMSLWSDFSRLIFHWSIKSRVGKTEWRQIAQKISICQKNSFKDIIKLINDSLSFTQKCLMNSPIITSKRNEGNVRENVRKIHKTSHFFIASFFTFHRTLMILFALNCYLFPSFSMSHFSTSQRSSYHHKYAQENEAKSKNINKLGCRLKGLIINSNCFIWKSIGCQNKANWQKNLMKIF